MLTLPHSTPQFCICWSVLFSSCLFIISLSLFLSLYYLSLSLPVSLLSLSLSLSLTHTHTHSLTHLLILFLPISLPLSLSYVFLYNSQRLSIWPSFSLCPSPQSVFVSKSFFSLSLFLSVSLFVLNVVLLSLRVIKSKRSQPMQSVGRLAGSHCTQRNKDNEDVEETLPHQNSKILLISINKCQIII
jgi:hypothetical protein